MKRVQIHGPDDVRVDEVPEPEIGPKDVLLEVAACGICGTDVGYAALGGMGGPLDSPMPLGHELSGTVARVGADVDDLVPGMRVVLDPGRAGFAIGNGGPEGGFCPRLRVRDAALGHNLFPIPDGLPFDLAALAEPIGVGMNAVDRVHVGRDDRVAVLGAGPIGLTALASALDLGVRDVVSIDLSDTRLEVARRLGATATINPAREDLWEALARRHGDMTFYGSRLVATDVFIEASGATSVLSEAIEHARPEARIAVVALHRRPVEVPFMTVMMKQLTLQGAMEYPARFERTLELLERREMSPMITHRFPLSAFPDAFEIARSPDAGAKVMIEIA